jgi:hypothetical protein
MVASLAWGGYRNGYMPAAALKPIGGGFRLEAGAARQFLGAAAELKREHGITLVAYVSETYRDFAGQVYQRARWTALGKPNNAAVPGNSIHGWAKAVDFNADALMNDGIYDVVMAVLEKYGFIRDVDGENWHVSFREAQVAEWASSTITPFEEDDMFNETDRYGANLVLNATARVELSMYTMQKKQDAVLAKLDLILWATTDESGGLRTMVQHAINLVEQVAQGQQLTAQQIADLGELTAVPKALAATVDSIGTAEEIEAAARVKLATKPSILAESEKLAQLNVPLTV